MGIIGTSYYTRGNVMENFTATGSVGASPYISEFVNLVNPYDCGRLGNNIWVANDAADSPVRGYNTGGSVIGSIPGALIGGVARGVDSDGTYLWVSNPSNDKIYKLDMSTGLELDTWGAIKARF